MGGEVVNALTVLARGPNIEFEWICCAARAQPAKLPHCHEPKSCLLGMGGGALMCAGCCFAWTPVPPSGPAHAFAAGVHCNFCLCNYAIPASEAAPISRVIRSNGCVLYSWISPSWWQSVVICLIKKEEGFHLPNVNKFNWILCKWKGGQQFIWNFNPATTCS